MGNRLTSRKQRFRTPSARQRNPCQRRRDLRRVSESVVEHGQVEPRDALRVGEEVELGDPPVLDRDGADRERPAVRGRSTIPAAPLTSARRMVRSTRDHSSAWPATVSAPRRCCDATGRVRRPPEHDVGVEHGDERVEITLAGGREERLDDLPLGGQVGVRDRVGAADAPARPAGQLPRRLGRALHDRARSRRTARRTCRAGRRPAARPGSASRARSAAPDRPSRRAAPRARDRCRRRGR